MKRGREDIGKDDKKKEDELVFAFLCFKLHCNYSKLATGSNLKVNSIFCQL